MAGDLLVAYYKF